MDRDLSVTFFLLYIFIFFFSLSLLFFVRFGFRDDVAPGCACPRDEKGGKEEAEDHHRHNTHFVVVHNNESGVSSDWMGVFSRTR